jgi:hypothetical protein
MLFDRVCIGCADYRNAEALTHIAQFVLNLIQPHERFVLRTEGLRRLRFENYSYRLHKHSRAYKI